MHAHLVTRRFLTATAFVLGAVLTGGCTKTEAKLAPNPTTVEARLAMADSKDGKTDKVITKCCGCNLHMDGKAENKLDVHGYTLQFCSPDCKGKFAKDPDASVMAMKID